MSEDEKLKQLLEVFKSNVEKSWKIIVNQASDRQWDDDAYFANDWLDELWQKQVVTPLVGENINFIPYEATYKETLSKDKTYFLENQSFPQGIFLGFY